MRTTMRLGACLALGCLLAGCGDGAGQPRPARGAEASKNKQISEIAIRYCTS